jgi:glutathione reductase (NADPH)
MSGLPETDRFDLVVLGGGSGGLACALRAAKHGARVALVEPGPLGGTCVHVGCVPKKATWFAAELGEAQALAQAYGFPLQPAALDWPRFVAVRRGYSDTSAASYARRLHEAGIEHIAARGRFESARVVRAGERVVEGREVVIATGARPRRADFEGGELGITSDGFFALQAPPRHIAIVGGGYVAVELAGVLRALGSEVCLFARGNELLSRDMDADVAGALRAAMQAQGIRAAVCSEVVAAARAADGYELECVGGDRHRGFDELLWAIGRVPNTEGLGLDGFGVRCTDRGTIEVDAQHRTSVPGVHAIGDVTPDPAFTPYAVRTGRALADRLFGGEPDACFAPEMFPTLAYAHPPIGAIGLGEAAARARHGDGVKVYTRRFVPMRLKLAGVGRPTLMKLVCIGPEERIIGLHVCGDAAEEMLQGFAVAVTMGATRADFNATLALHPTSAEEFVLIG